MKKDFFTRWQKPFSVGLIVFIVAIWGYVIFYTAHSKSDWIYNYLPSVRDLLQGNSPYTDNNAFNPFWTYVLLIPFSLLPPLIGNAAVGLACMFTFAIVGYKLGAKPLPLAMLLFSPQMMFLSRNGGIDWMVAIGFILPPQIGLFFVLIKPQIGIAVAIFWFFEAWRIGKFREVFRVFAPVLVGYFIGYVLFGMNAIWRGSQFIGSNHPWDATTFPLSIPVGLVLLVSSIRSHNLNTSILASPFLAPYVAFYSWPAAVLGLSNKKWEMVAAVLGMWILALLTLQL